MRLQFPFISLNNWERWAKIRITVIRSSTPQSRQQNNCTLCRLRKVLLWTIHPTEKLIRMLFTKKSSAKKNHPRLFRSKVNSTKCKLNRHAKRPQFSVSYNFISPKGSIMFVLFFCNAGYVYAILQVVWYGKTSLRKKRQFFLWNINALYKKSAVSLLDEKWTIVAVPFMDGHRVSLYVCVNTNIAVNRCIIRDAYPSRFNGAG